MHFRRDQIASMAGKPTSVVDGVNRLLNFVVDGTVYIHGDFDDSILLDIVPAMVREIDERKDKKDPKIAVYINSDGGYTHCLKPLLSLFERAKKLGIVVETYAFARTYSCASILACAGSKGHRFIGEHTEHLCHLGFATTNWSSNDTQAEREHNRVKAHFDWVRSIYRRYASIKDLDKVIHNDSLFIRGGDILANGLADEIV